MPRSVLIFLFLLSFSTQAQVGLDSLNAVWLDESKLDSIRCKAKFEIGRQLASQDPELAVKSFRELLKFSRTAEGYDHGYAYQGLAVMLGNLSHLDSAEYFTKKALEAFESSGNMKGVATCYANLGYSAQRAGNYEGAKTYLQKSIDLASSKKDTGQLIQSLINLKDIYHQTAEIDTAIFLGRRTLSLAKETKRPRSIAQTSSSLAYEYQTSGQLDQAIDLLSSALKYLDMDDDIRLRADVLNTLGMIYRDVEDFESSIKNFEEAVLVISPTKDPYQIGAKKLNLVHSYLGLEEMQKALSTAEEAIELLRSARSPLGVATAMGSKGEVLMFMEEYDLAIEVLLSTNDSLAKYGEKLNRSVALGHLANCYYQIGNNDRAIEYGKLGLHLAQEADSKSYAIHSAKILHKAYAKKERFKEAYDALNVLTSAQDSLKTEENKRKLFRAEYKYEYEKKALADSLAQNEEKLKLELAHQDELHAETRTRNYLIGAGGFLLLLAGGGWSRVQFVRKKNAQLKEARHKAEESERFKQRFLANMSHEIRTPMNAVLGMTELTLDTELTPKQKNYLEAVKHSSENLLVIVNDILDLSKLEQGELTLEKIPFRLKQQVDLVYQTFRFKAEEKGLVFKVNWDEKLDDRVVGDPSRLTQVLMNLTANAIKFTEKGEVSIDAHQVSEGRIRFAITDSGIGIGKDKQETIFESFKQADESTSRKYGGTGLGLAICKDLVELQGGTIKMESELYQGSTFSFELDLPKAEVEVPEADAGMLVETLSGIRILVAEDNEYNQIVVQDTLENMIPDVNVTIAADGEQALEAMKELVFDIILMDARMPIMDGVAATIEIRKSGNDIPIIALTASVLNDEIHRCLDAGMNDALPKPFKREELLGVLGKYYNASS